MSDRTAIEWTEATWNPTTGCDRVSPGCDHCYALTLAKRLKAAGNPRYQQDRSPRSSGPGFGLTLHWDKLEEPLRWRRQRLIFVDSMSDLFHKDVLEAFVRRVFRTMAATARHTYQILTKRTGRMASIVRRVQPNPLSNVWLGTSVENQRWAGIRIPKLLKTPAAVRFLSCEPLLGPLDLRRFLAANPRTESPGGPGLHWIIVGGESGPGHRPMDVSWVRSLRDQCLAAGIPCFFKQWGGHTPKAGGRELDGETWDQRPDTRYLESWGGLAEGRSDQGAPSSPGPL